MKINRLLDRRTQLRDQIDVVQEQLHSAEGDFGRLFDEYLDKIADAANAARDIKDKSASGRAWTQIDKRVDDKLRATLVEVGWHGVTRETVDQQLAEEIAARAALKVDLIFVLSLIDSVARKAADEYPDFTGEDIEKGYVKIPDSHEHRELFERLVEVGWRGATRDTFDHVFTRAVGDRIIKLCIDGHEPDSVIDGELAKLPLKDHERAFENFRKRLADEYEKIRWRDRARRVEELVAEKPDYGQVALMPPSTQAVNQLVDRLRTSPWPDGAGFYPAFSGLLPDWSDTSLMKLGAREWKEIHEQGVDCNSEEAIDILMNEIGTLYAPASKSKAATALSYAVFALRWSIDAFQKIVTTHTYAAALMATNVTRESLEDVVLPWRGFLIAVPDGLLKIEHEDGVEFDYTRIAVCVTPDGGGHMMIYAPGATAANAELPRTFSEHTASIADLLTVERSEVIGPDGPRELPATLTRVFALARRLVAGLLFALQHRENFREHGPRDASKKRREKDEPAHRVVFVGRALKVDCRSAIRAYLHGSRKYSPPSMQTLVCGHWKRQVIGVGRLGRKVIHIEPYWRGPEDAPILTRPKQLGGR